MLSNKRVVGVHFLKELFQKRAATKPVTVFLHTSCACKAYTPSYTRTVSEEEESQPVYQYIGKHRKRFKRIHVCGLTVTGALGVLRLPLPENKLRTRPRYSQVYPYRLPIDDITNAACGHGYSLFATGSRANTIKLYGCGINTDSQIGVHKSRYYKPKDVPENSSFHYVMEPSPMPLPFKEPDKTKIVDVTCGRAHSLILTDNEGIFALGNNAFGQCGRPIVEGEIYQNSAKIHRIPPEVFPCKVVKVMCGMDHSLFLTEEGQVFACGWGADGQTGLESLEPTSEPTLVKGDLDGVKVKQISSFADTTLALSDSNEVFGWGSSEYGQLACVSESTQVVTPTRLPFTRQRKIVEVAMGGTAGLLLNDVGEVWVWGHGVLGKGPNLNSATWPRRIPMTLFGLTDFKSDIRVKKIKCGLGSFAAITNTSELYCWGKNRNGCLGIGSHRDQHFPWKVIMGSEVTDVACGVDHMIIMSKSLV